MEILYTSHERHVYLLKQKKTADDVMTAYNSELMAWIG